MRKWITFITMTALLLFASCSDNRSPEKMYEDATNFYRDGKIQKAIKTYKKLTDTYPDSELAVKVTYKLAEVYAGDLEDYETCVAYYCYLADEYPSDPSAPKARFMAAYTMANIMKDYKAAQTEYKKFVRDYPDHSLIESVEFELRNMGKQLDEIDELKGIMKQSTTDK